MRQNGQRLPNRKVGTWETTRTTPFHIISSCSPFLQHVFFDFLLRFSEVFLLSFLSSYCVLLRAGCSPLGTMQHSLRQADLKWSEYICIVPTLHELSWVNAWNTGVYVGISLLSNNQRSSLVARLVPKTIEIVCSGTPIRCFKQWSRSWCFHFAVVLPGRKPLASYQLCVGNLGAQVSDADLYNAFRSDPRRLGSLGMNQVPWVQMHRKVNS